MLALLAAALVGCSCNGASDPFSDLPPTPPTPGFTDPGLATTGASPAFRLWELEGRYVLPPSTLPEGATPESRFPIDLRGGQRENAKGKTLYRAPSPFPEAVEGEARMAAPPGMRVYADGKEIPYDPDLRLRSWRLNQDKIVIAWDGPIEPTVEVVYPEVAIVAQTREFASAGKDPADFVKDEVSLSDQTRLGMLLPAPGTASWDLTVPEGGRFEAWTAMAPLPLRMLVGDGAEVVLTVIEGGARTEVGRKWIDAHTESFGRWTADLAPWAGKAVTIELASEPGPTNAYDHVFLGSPTIWGKPTDEVRHVVVIGIDTTRPDHFSSYGYDRPTTPELDAVAASGVVFETTWTPAPRTRPSFRSAFTGRRPLDAVGAPNVAEIFAAHGFATAGIVANVHLQPRFDFNDGFDWWWFDGQSRADEQVDRALDWLSEHRDRDTFLFLHIMDPHLPYRPPEPFKTEFTTDPSETIAHGFGRSDVYGWIRKGKLSDGTKQAVRDLYDAELRFTSQQLGRLFAQLDRMPGKKVVALHSDHGEELFEHGQFEHNHTVYEETTRGLLWFRAGGGQLEGRRIATPTTLADIAPTLVELAGFPNPPKTDGRSLAGILRGEVDPATWADREIGVAHLRYGTERWAVVRDGHKYILHTGTGQEELYDLRADPHEEKDLARGVPLGPYREALERAHDMTVGRGWRIAVKLDAKSPPVTWTLPQPAVAAGIVDPEARIPNPANEEWGEKPKITAAEIGEVTLSEDRTQVTFVPGPRAMGGLLYVLFDTDVDPTSTTSVRGDAPQMTTVVRGEVGWKAGQQSWTITPGTVLVPPVDEATRIRLLRGEEAKEAGLDTAELRALGYLDGD